MSRPLSSILNELIEDLTHSALDYCIEHKYRFSIESTDKGKVIDIALHSTEDFESEYHYFYTYKLEDLISLESLINNEIQRKLKTKEVA